MRKLKNIISADNEALVIKAAAIFQQAVSIQGIATEKASMSEIFAAMSGVTCAGVTLVMLKKENLANHPVAILGLESAKLRWDIGSMIFRAGGPRRNPDKEEEGVEIFLEFLKRANVAIKKYPDVQLFMPLAKTPGGNLKDVSAHIEDILHREMIGISNRPKSVIVIENSTYGRFPAHYLPKAQKADFAKDEDCEETMDVEGVAPQKRNQKPPKFRAAAKSYAPAFE